MNRAGGDGVQRSGRNDDRDFVDEELALFARREMAAFMAFGGYQARAMAATWR